MLSKHIIITTYLSTLYVSGCEVLCENLGCFWSVGVIQVKIQRRLDGNSSEDLKEMPGVRNLILYHKDGRKIEVEGWSFESQGTTFDVGMVTNTFQSSLKKLIWLRHWEWSSSLVRKNNIFEVQDKYTLDFVAIWLGYISYLLLIFSQYLCLLLTILLLLSE